MNCQIGLTTDSNKVMNDGEKEAFFVFLEAKKLEPHISRMAVGRFFSLGRSLTAYIKELLPNGGKAAFPSLSKGSAGGKAPLGKRSRIRGALF